MGESLCVSMSVCEGGEGVMMGRSDVTHIIILLFQHHIKLLLTLILKL